MKRGDSWERREIKFTARGHNPATTTINMWNQCSDLLTGGRTVFIKNAKVDVYKDCITLTSTAGTTIERVCTLYTPNTYATKHHIFVVSGCLHGILVSSKLVANDL